MRRQQKGRSRSNGRNPAATRAALAEAARLAFLTDGYERTDTNRIARAAGFAPQTFYRHFEDKRAVFLEVYRQWVAEGVGAVLKEPTPTAAARRLIDEHTRMQLFRRTLRNLSAIDPEVQKVRAEQRSAQLASLLAKHPAVATQRIGELLAWLLSIERWVDALVEGELKDFDLSRAEATKILIRMIGRLFEPDVNGSL